MSSPTTPPKKPATYARGTDVTPQRSREELSRLLEKYGATGFGYIDHKEAAAVSFVLGGRTYRFLLRLPALADFKSMPPAKNRVFQPDRTPAQQKAAHDQAVRERWRALIAVIKGKLIAVDAGIETFEEALMQYIVVPGTDKTVAEYIEPQIQAAFSGRGSLPPALPKGNS